MPSFHRTRKAEIQAASFGLRPWVCIALLCGPLLGAAQRGTDLSGTHLRASVDPPSLLRPTTPVITPELRGDIYMARKMYRDAIDMYRQSPKSSGIDNKIGIAFHEMSRLQLAKKYYEQAIAEEPTFAEAINNVGTVYYSQRSYGKAIRYFKRSLKYSGPVAAVYANLGAAYFGRHDYNKSSSYYGAALKLDPDVLESRSGFGILIQDRTVTDIALFHLYLAETYAKAGSNERALVYLRKALEEGLKNRKKLGAIPEFSTLKAKPEFQELLAENPKPL